MNGQLPEECLQVLSTLNRIQESLLKTKKNEKKSRSGLESTLRNIATMSASSNVKVDEAKSVGERFLTIMTGTTVAQFVPRRANQCILMSAKGDSSAKDNKVHVDPCLLFQTLVIVARRTNG